jgi:hypothetical protein
MRLKKLPVLFCIAILPFTQSGCDSLTEFVKNLSEPQHTEESEPIAPSYEKVLLLDILENQRALIEDIRYASDSGEKKSISGYYEEFLRLDKNYQDEFQKHEEGLSTKDGWEISKMHQQIIRSLPTYSSLMSN